MSNKAYHNEGFGVAFLTIVVFTIIVPALMILSIDDGFAKFVSMRGFGSECWENSKHERTCRGDNTCKFGRNFCIEEVYRWKTE